MEIIEINHNYKMFRIKREIIIYVLMKLSGKDYSEYDNKTILKAMKRYCLIDEITLESMQAN